MQQGNRSYSQPQTQHEHQGCISATKSCDAVIWFTAFPMLQQTLLVTDAAAGSRRPMEASCTLLMLLVISTKLSCWVITSGSCNAASINHHHV
jgi:hypothetical protein